MYGRAGSSFVYNYDIVHQDGLQGRAYHFLRALHCTSPKCTPGVHAPVPWNWWVQVHLLHPHRKLVLVCSLWTVQFKRLKLVLRSSKTYQGFSRSSIQFLNFQFKVKAVKNLNFEFKVFQHLALKILEIQGNFKGNSFKAKGYFSRVNQYFQFKVLSRSTLENIEISRQLQGCTFQWFCKH